MASEKMTSNSTGTTPAGSTCVMAWSIVTNTSKNNSTELSIEVEDLYMETRKDHIPTLENPASQEFRPPTSPTIQSQTRSKTIKELEKNALMEALKITEGNIEQAAKRLDISRATIYRKIKKYKIE